MNIDKRVSLNLSVRGLEQSATLAINEKSKSLQKQGSVIYRLGLGQSPFPVPVPIVEALQNHAHEKDYLPPQGLLELRNAVADFHRRKDNVDAEGEFVLIGPGSKELMFILQLAYYGELIVPTPCWVSYVPQAKIIGRHVRLLHTDANGGYRITSQQLQRFFESEHDDFRPRILVLNYPGNPDGCSYTAQELEAIAEIARRYEVVLLSDEIYGQLHHDGRHVSVARFYPEGTIISSGLSKWCGAGGWRLGTFTFPGELNWLLEAMTVIASETYTSVSAPIQYAAVRAFRGGVKIERYLWHARRILKKTGLWSANQLNQARIKTFLPAGGFYLFPNFEAHRESLAERGIHDSETLSVRLLEETGIASLPGTAFERDSKELTMRIAYVDFDGARALTASETLPLDQDLPDDFIANWCPKVLEAVNRIVRWIEQ